MFHNFKNCVLGKAPNQFDSNNTNSIGYVKVVKDLALEGCEYMEIRKRLQKKVGRALTSEEKNIITQVLQTLLDDKTENAEVDDDKDSRNKMPAGMDKLNNIVEKNEQIDYPEVGRGKNN